MNLPGNVIWLICGGFMAAMGYFFGGLILCFTIIGIPFGLQCFKIGGFVLWPFGKKILASNNADGCLSVICNLIWIVTGGLYTAFIHVIFGLLLTITVIGIPFARQHFKLAGLSLAPFGKEVVYD